MQTHDRAHSQARTHARTRTHTHARRNHTHTRTRTRTHTRTRTDARPKHTHSRAHAHAHRWEPSAGSLPWNALEAFNGIDELIDRGHDFQVGREHSGWVCAAYYYPYRYSHR